MNFWDNFKNKQSNKTQESQTQDPLNTWRDKESTPLSQSYKLTEDDIRVMEKDPKIQSLLDEDNQISASDSFENHINSNLFHEIPQTSSLYRDTEKTDGISFEDEDLSLQWQNKEQVKKEDVSVKESPLEMYSVKEFDLMENAAIFLFKESNKLKTPIKKPVFENGQELDIDQIKELAKEYYSFAKDNPQEFAEAKVQTGKWKKANLEWRHKKFNDKDSWFTQKGTEIFYSKENPKNFIKSTSGATFYEETGKVNTKLGTAHFIEPRMPKK